MGFNTVAGNYSGFDRGVGTCSSALAIAANIAKFYIFYLCDALFFS